MNKLNLTILVIIALIIGFIAGWLIFGMKSTTGNAKNILANTTLIEPDLAGNQCSPVPHTCKCTGFGLTGTCSTSTCSYGPDGELRGFNCNCCSKSAD